MQSIRSITVSPEFFMDQPEAAARIIRRKMKAEPADLWLIAIGKGDPARAIMDQLWMYGPADPLASPSPAPSPDSPEPKEPATS